MAVDEELLTSWARHLRGRRRSAITIASYRSDVVRLLSFDPDRAAIDFDVDAIERFLTASRESGLAPATVSRRERSIRQFYAFLVRRGLVDRNPLDGVRIPSAGSPGIVADGHVATLLGSFGHSRTTSTTPADARDLAIVLVLLTTGIRTSELVAIRTDDVDVMAGAIVVGRASARRRLGLLGVTAKALRAYAEVRPERLTGAADTNFWVGSRGAMTSSGVRQMLARRCRAAGVVPIMPADFRWVFARSQLDHGVARARLMELGGWKTTSSLDKLRIDAV